MTSIPMIDLMTIIFVLVDDWYKSNGVQLLNGKVGAKPNFTDSEMITLMLAQEFIPFPSETQYVGFNRANYLALFPKLVDQSQYNRRACALRILVEHLRRYWIVQKGCHLQTRFLLDTKPVPVLGYKRDKRRSDFAGKADYSLWTPSRTNQKYLNSPNLDRLLSKIRERIEDVFHEIQDTGRNIERLLAKTVLGLTTRVITKMTAHLLRHQLLIDFGVNVQTFEVVSAS